MEKSRP